MRQRRTVFMFSGQGSQYYQMGKELYDQHPVFRETFDRGDAYVSGRAGFSVAAQIFSGARSEVCDDLRLTHPALVIVEYALFRTLLSEGIRPDLLWGSSLGEIVAAAAAEVIPLESVLDAVLEQVRIVTATVAPGGMLAVLESPGLYDELTRSGYRLTLAGVNFNRHFTIAGDAETLTAVEALLKGRQITCQRLPVKYAFHSAAIDGIEPAYRRYLGSLPLAPPRIPYLSGILGREIDTMDSGYFWNVIRQPMRFGETVASLEQQGPWDYVDCGPSGTSATFVKYNLAADSASAVHPILTPFQHGVQKLAQLKQKLLG